MKKIINLRSLFLSCFLLSAATLVYGQSDYFGKWPAGTSPKEVGKRLGENFVRRDFEYESGKRPFVIYTEVCAGYGALKVAKETGDKDLTARLVKKFERFLTPDANSSILWLMSITG